MKKRKFFILLALSSAIAFCVAFALALLFNLGRETHIDEVYRRVHYTINEDPNCCLVKTQPAARSVDPNITYIQLGRVPVRYAPLKPQSWIRRLKYISLRQLLRSRGREEWSLLVQVWTDRNQEEENRIRHKIHASNPYRGLRITYYRSRLYHLK